MPTSAAQWVGLILLLVSGAAAIALLFRCRVFHASSVIGPNRVNVPALVGGLLLTAMIGFITSIAATSMLLLILGVSRFQSARSPTDSATTQPIQLTPAVVYASLYGVVIAWMVMITLLRILHPDSLRWLGMRLTDLRRSALAAALAVLIILPVTFWALIFFQWLYLTFDLHTENTHPMLKLLRDFPNTLPAVIVSACVVAPLFEELIFRGCIQSAAGAMLEKHEVAGRWIAIAISSALFALVHGEPWMMPPLFVLSMGLGYAYERTGNLWVPIVTHAVFNAVSIVVFLISMR